MKRTFEAEIREGRGGGAWVEIPFDPRQAFGSVRPKVRATFQGEPYRGSIAPMGGGVYVLGIRKEIRAAIGKDIGDTIRVTVEPDTAPRTIDVPRDLRTALAKAGLSEAFDAMAYTHRRRHVQAIAEAKKPETRARRIRKAVETIRAAAEREHDR